MARTPRKALSQEQIRAAQRLEMLWRAKQDEVKKMTGRKPSQEDAANQLGFETQGGFNSYIKGRIPLNIERLLDFSRFFDVSPDEIYPELAQKLGELRHQYNPTDKKIHIVEENSPSPYTPMPDREAMTDAIEWMFDLWDSDVIKMKGAQWTAQTLIILMDLLRDPAARELSKDTIIRLIK